MARQLRRIARTSRHDTVRELIVTEAIRAWLNHRGSFAPTPRHIGTILLACGPLDPDPVGPESLALLLRFHGRPSRVLAARTPTFTLTIAAQAADTTAVVVFCSEPRARRQTIGRLRAVQALGYPAYFTGTAFGSQRSRRHVPGQYLGTRIQDACTQLIHEHTSEHRG